MKKRIGFYIILIIIIGFFAFFNISAAVNPNDLKVMDIKNSKGVITVIVETKPFKKLSSYKTEIVGNTCYISVNAKNSLSNKKQKFSVSFSNKNNSIQYVYIIKDKLSKLIYTNNYYGKTDVFYDNTEIK